MGPSALLAAGKFKRQRQDSGDARHKAVRFLAIDMCNPRFPFRLLNQSGWHPYHHLSDLTGHSDAKVGKVCDASGPRMSHNLVDSHWSMAWHLQRHQRTRAREQAAGCAVCPVQDYSHRKYRFVCLHKGFDLSTLLSFLEPLFLRLQEVGSP